MVKEIIYIEGGYYKYPITKIEKALEDRLILHSLALSKPSNASLNEDQDIIFERCLKSNNNKYHLAYQRYNNYEILKNNNGSKNSIRLTPFQKIEELLKPENTYDAICLVNSSRKNHTWVILFNYETDKLVETVYDDSESWAIPFLKRAFKNYTGKELPSNELHNDNLAKYLADIQESKTPSQGRKMIKQKGIDVINMIVDEFAPYLLSS